MLSMFVKAWKCFGARSWSRWPGISLTRQRKPGWHNFKGDCGAVWGSMFGAKLENWQCNCEGFAGVDMLLQLQSFWHVLSDIYYIDIDVYRLFRGPCKWSTPTGYRNVYWAFNSEMLRVLCSEYCSTKHMGNFRKVLNLLALRLLPQRA